MNRLVLVLLFWCGAAMAATAQSKISSDHCEGDAQDDVVVSKNKTILIYSAQGLLLKSGPAGVDGAVGAFGVTQTNHILVKAETFGLDRAAAGGSCVLLQNINVVYGKVCPSNEAAPPPSSDQRPSKLLGTNQFGAFICPNPQER